VHGGELRLRPRGHGGSSFECLLPLREPPPHLPESETA
jgi:two-component system, OmpR family, sensor histidine kinase KdpD